MATRKKNRSVKEGITENKIHTNLAQVILSCLYVLFSMCHDYSWIVLMKMEKSKICVQVFLLRRLWSEAFKTRRSRLEGSEGGYVFVFILVSAYY